jgi:uncharacterized protein DUF4038/collagenase-like protein with putative collagen-binding domain
VASITLILNQETSASEHGFVGGLESIFRRYPYRLSQKSTKVAAPSATKSTTNFISAGIFLNLLDIIVTNVQNPYLMRRHSIPLWLVVLFCSAVFLPLEDKSMAATPAYPLKRGANPRYLVDQNGRPFLIQGDSPWSMMVQLTKEETEQYLINRHRKGFNSIIVNLIEHLAADNPPFNAYGEPPFTTPGDFSTPNPAYFAHVDWVLKKAAQYRIQVFLFPSYLGGGNEGWYQEMLANGVTKCKNYGRFLGQRYKDFDNIVWLNGGDYNPPNKDVVSAIAEGILEVDSNHLHTAHCAAETSALEYYPGESWLHINNTYSYSPVLIKSRADYARVPAAPFFLAESGYEGYGLSAQDLRRQAYWSLFSGSCGTFFGNFPLWEFFPGWQQAMDDAGSYGMANQKRLMDSRSWWTFVPDPNNTIVVAGFGDPDSSDPSQYYVTAARAADGSSLWAYIPTARTVTVDMSKISGSIVQTWWYNPRTGAASAIGQFANVGLRDFTAPATEGATQDWVLVADDVSRNLPPPGLINIQMWRSTFFNDQELDNLAISGNTHDPDHDGRNNLMEYSLCSDPTVPDIALTPIESGLATSGSEQYLTLSYTRRRNASDLSFKVNGGSDLQAWSLLQNANISNNGFTDSVTAQDNFSINSTAKRFLRLEVTLTFSEPTRSGRK